jgi:hypothetical protein
MSSLSILLKVNCKKAGEVTPSSLTIIQRGLIYTENKPLCLLCKMFNPFFYEFLAMPSVKVSKLGCCTATIYTTETNG